jgi:hypothetical protein
MFGIYGAAGIGARERGRASDLRTRQEIRGYCSEYLIYFGTMFRIYPEIRNQILIVTLYQEHHTLTAGRDTNGL